MGVMGGGSYTTGEVAERARCSFRQLDYWARNGTLIPGIADASGHGSRRRYTTADVERARVLVELSALGATSPVLARVVAELAGEDMHEWPLLLFVLVDGTVSHTIVPGVACYVVDVGGLCAAGYGRRRVRSPAA